MAGRSNEQWITYVGMHLAGRDAATAMPLVQANVVRCAGCREQFEQRS